MASETDEPLVGVHLGSLRHLPLSDLLIRFAFGAAISAVAAVIALLAGSEPGGLLLAFPAILPATLTLVEKEEGERQAEDVDVGAILGATALAAFALVVWHYMGNKSALLTLVVATAAWLVGAVLLYLGLRLLRSRDVPLHTGLTEAIAAKERPRS
jgi:uncharacterized membrane protein (GlpM family)